LRGFEVVADEAGDIARDAACVPDLLDVVLVGAREPPPDVDGDLAQRLGLVDLDALGVPVLVRAPPSARAGAARAEIGADRLTRTT
jgi:hypothetical protein